MITNYLKLGKPLFGKIKLRKDDINYMILLSKY